MAHFLPPSLALCCRRSREARGTLPRLPVDFSSSACGQVGKTALNCCAHWITAHASVKRAMRFTRLVPVKIDLKCTPLERSNNLMNNTTQTTEKATRTCTNVLEHRRNTSNVLEYFKSSAWLSEQKISWILL